MTQRAEKPEPANPRVNESELVFEALCPECGRWLWRCTEGFAASLEKLLEAHNTSNAHHGRLVERA